MAERRMFAKTIVLSDEFLDMPPTARCLYFTLGMFADDDGFVNSPKGIMRQCGAVEDDLKILLAKKFLISFESGVIVIKHWRINNYLQKDRYKATVYTEERDLLDLDEKGNYHKKESDDKPMYTDSVYTDSVYTQDSIGKDSIGEYREGEDSIGNTPPLPPTGETKQKPSKKSSPSFEFDFDSVLEGYTWTTEMKALVKSFFTDYRKAIKKPYKTEWGIKKQLKAIEEEISVSGEEFVEECINETMRNEWEGIFFNRDRKRKSPKQETRHETKEEYLNRMAKEWGYTPEGENDFTGNTEIIDAD